VDAKKSDGTPTDWERICRCVSEGFVLSGRNYQRLPDRIELGRLLEAKDEDIRALARKRLELEHLRDDMFSKTFDWNAISQAMMLDLTRSLYQSDKGEVNGLDEAIGQFRNFMAEATSPNSVLGQVEKEMAAKIAISVKGLLGDRHFRHLVKKAAQERANKELGVKDVTAIFKVIKPDDAVVVLKNRTKADLHHCLIICELEVDASAVMKEAVQREAPDAMRTTLLGADWYASMGRFRKQQWLYQAVDKGSVVWVEEWKPSDSLEVFISSISSLMLGGKSASISLFSDEGSIVIPFDISQMQNNVRARFGLTTVPSNSRH
jgi:hypothetical protein